MTHLTTEQLQNIQVKADSMLEAIIERLGGSTQLQAALRHVMRASDEALSAFEQLAADEPAVLLLSRGSVGTLPLPSCQQAHTAPAAPRFTTTRFG